MEPRKEACSAKPKEPSEGACACDRWQPPAWDLRLAWTVLLVAASILPFCVFANLGGRCVLIIYGLTYVLGCWKTKRAMHFVVPSLHLPTMWIPLSYAATSPSRASALQAFWVLPGRIPASMLPDGWQAWAWLVATIATLAIFFIAVMLARPSRRTAIYTLVCLLVFSAISSF